MTRAGLTASQHRLLNFLRSFIAENGYSPTYAQMADHMGFTSRGGIARLVEALVDRGYVTKRAREACSIAVVEDAPAQHISAADIDAAKEQVQQASDARAVSRNFAGVYLRRGHLVKNPCEACGAGDSQMHHQDHERPLEVTWLCRPCHLDWHERWRDISRAEFLKWLEGKKSVAVCSVSRGMEPAA